MFCLDEMLPKGTITTDVVVAPEVPRTEVEGVNDVLANEVMDASDKQKVDEGKNLLIYLDVQPVNETIPAVVEDKKKVEQVVENIVAEIIRNDAEVEAPNQVDSGVRLIDVSLLKKFEGESEVTKIPTTGNNMITVTIEIPSDIYDEGRDYSIVRVHDGVAEVLHSTLNEDKTLTFETNKFSTYAITYVAKNNQPAVFPTPAPASENNNSNTTPAVTENPAPASSNNESNQTMNPAPASSNNASNQTTTPAVTEQLAAGTDTKPKAPKTEDDFNMGGWIAVLFIGVLGLGGMKIANKKKKRS